MNLEPRHGMYPRPMGPEAFSFPRGINFSFSLVLEQCSFLDTSYDKSASILLMAHLPAGERVEIFFTVSLEGSVWDHTGTLEKKNEIERWFADNVRIRAKLSEDRSIVVFMATCSPFLESFGGVPTSELPVIAAQTKTGH